MNKLDENNRLIDIFFDDASVADSAPPKFVLFTGGVGSGKTTMRKDRNGTGYVVVDGGEIFRLVSEGKETEEFEKYLPAIHSIGTEVMNRAVRERRNIVMEIIGADAAKVETVIESMKQIGYTVEIIFVDCEPGEAYKRHLKAVKDDPQYLSCYFTEPLHMKWVIEAGINATNSSVR